MLFFLLINVKMPTIVGFNIYEQEKFEVSMEFFYNLGGGPGPGLGLHYLEMSHLWSLDMNWQLFTFFKL